MACHGLGKVIQHTFTEDEGATGAYEMKILSFIIVFFSILAVAAFFMPWVKGAGSIVKPVDDSTKPIQDLEPTGMARETVKTTKGIIDTLTGTLVPIKLKRTLAGYQIPISEDKAIKRIGAVVYFLYILPVIAILAAAFNLTPNRGKITVLSTFLVTLAVFVLMYKQVSALNREGLFVKIESCKGFWLTMYSFLGISLAAFIKLLTTTKKHMSNLRDRTGSRP